MVGEIISIPLHPSLHKLYLEDLIDFKGRQWLAFLNQFLLLEKQRIKKILRLCFLKWQKQQKKKTNFEDQQQHWIIKGINKPNVISTQHQWAGLIQFPAPTGN